MMNINITLPRNKSFFRILYKTKKYYNKLRIQTIVEDENKRYYLFLGKRNIQVQLAANDENTKQEVQKYLEHILENSYIGIPEKYYDFFELKGVKKIKIQ